MKYKIYKKSHCEAPDLEFEIEAKSKEEVMKKFELNEEDFTEEYPQGDQSEPYDIERDKSL